jgi:hypothetical protein
MFQRFSLTPVRVRGFMEQEVCHGERQFKREFKLKAVLHRWLKEREQVSAHHEGAALFRTVRGDRTDKCPGPYRQLA